MVHIKSFEDIDKIRIASQIVARTLQVLSQYVQTGITTLELDAIAESEIRKAGARPAFKGYGVFPERFVFLLMKKLFTAFRQNES